MPVLRQTKDYNGKGKRIGKKTKPCETLINKKKQSENSIEIYEDDIGVPVQESDNPGEENLVFLSNLSKTDEQNQSFATNQTTKMLTIQS